MESRNNNQNISRRIDAVIEKIQSSNESIAWYESRNDEFMVKMEKRSRAAYRGQLSRLQKMAGF